ncbi:acyl-CoA thioesterase [Nocardiopsis sp. LOL_012]|uniref:acyl-CoA thioesterase n=1 Tax=Nocardiopsis sp. LOL_012 TaxID=3345409 RepID=UPI003A8A9C83
MSLTLEGVLADHAALAPERLRDFHGFGGLHGGLAAALMARRMRALAPPGRSLVSLNTRFLAPVGGPVRVEPSVARTGATVTAIHAWAREGTAPVVSADGVFGASGAAGGFPALVPPMPSGLVPRERAREFRPPPEFVPISTRMRILPATEGLPYSGAAEPRLCAWVRLTEPVADAAERLLVLVDALAPSYAAVLTDLVAVPTVSLNVHVTADPDARFDWVLVDARTTAVDPGGWVSEAIDVWSEAGTHLASASQLRLVRAPRAHTSPSVDTEKEVSP